MKATALSPLMAIHLLIQKTTRQKVHGLLENKLSPGECRHTKWKLILLQVMNSAQCVTLKI